jgi:hypothetical protein
MTFWFRIRIKLKWIRDRIEVTPDSQPWIKAKTMYCKYPTIGIYRYRTPDVSVRKQILKKS